MGEQGITQQLWQCLMGRRPTSLRPPEVCAYLAIPRYPPFPEGLPATPVEAVVASQSELLSTFGACWAIRRENLTAGFRPFCTAMPPLCMYCPPQRTITIEAQAACGGTVWKSR